MVDDSKLSKTKTVNIKYTQEYERKDDEISKRKPKQIGQDRVLNRPDLRIECLGRKRLGQWGVDQFIDSRGACGAIGALSDGAQACYQISQKRLANPETRDLRCILRGSKSPGRREKGAQMKLLLFLVIELVVAVIAVFYGFIGWYVGGILNIVDSPIASLSILDIGGLLFRIGLFLIVALVNYYVIKEDESEGDYL